MTAYKVTLDSKKEINIISANAIKEIVSGCEARFGCSVVQITTWSKDNGHSVCFSAESQKTAQNGPEGVFLKSNKID